MRRRVGPSGAPRGIAPTEPNAPEVGRSAGARGIAPTEANAGVAAAVTDAAPTTTGPTPGPATRSQGRTGTARRSSSLLFLLLLGVLWTPEWVAPTAGRERQGTRVTSPGPMRPRELRGAPVPMAGPVAPE